MDDDLYSARPLARWYWAGAAASLLLMVFPITGAVIHLTTDPATLPLDERALFEAEPLWMVLAFGMTGLAGSLGGLMLLLRRKVAQPLLLIALISVAAWFAGLFVNQEVRDLLSTDQIAMAIVVVVIVWTIFWFARHSSQRGWLR